MLAISRYSPAIYVACFYATHHSPADAKSDTVAGLITWPVAKVDPEGGKDGEPGMARVVSHASK